MSPDGMPNAVYFTGDTVLMPVHAEMSKEFHIVVAIMNIRDARIPLHGQDEPLQITMGGKDAAKPFRQLQEEILVSIH